MRIMCPVCDEGDPGATTAEITLELRGPGRYQCPNCGDFFAIIIGGKSVADVVVALIYEDAHALHDGFTRAQAARAAALSAGDGAIEAEFRVHSADS